MQLTLGGKVYYLNFGIEFLREIDKRYDFRTGELQIGFGMGLMMLMPQLTAGSAVAIFDVIQAGCAGQRVQPSRMDIENYLFSDDVELLDLADDFTEAFNESQKITKVMETLVKASERMNAKQGETETEAEAPALAVVKKKTTAKPKAAKEPTEG